MPLVRKRDLKSGEMPSDNNYYILLTDLKTNFIENYSYAGRYVTVASW